MNKWALLLLVAGCTGTRGDGNVQSDERSLPPFDSIEVRGIIELTVDSGAGPRVVVTSDANLLPLVKTTVENGKLVVTTDPNVGRFTKLALSARVENLRALYISGAAEALLLGVQSDALRIEVSGAARVRGAGTTRALFLDGSGAAHFELDDLVSEEASVTLSGAGSAAVHVQKRLTVEISGAGKVTYKGQPLEVTKRVSGLGSIAQKP
jgi:hypothetical protein